MTGLAAVLLWVVLCIRWFDVAAPFRPVVLAAVPPWVLLAATLVPAALWLRGRRRALAGAPLGAQWRPLLLVLALAFFFRLPVVAGGAASAVTPDGSLSGIVALRLAEGSERLVFVPHVPYSGSLKSHVVAVLMLALDPARAFALGSVLFYLLHVAGLHRLALLVASPRAALLAGLFAAFSPAFVTRYSLSNDGNYVEVLALGTWALWLAARAAREEEHRETLALAAGLLLGLGFWCHILAVVHLAAIAALFAILAAAAGGGVSRRVLPLVALGFGAAVGYVPGLLWNAASGWLSFHYLVPGEARAGETGAAGLAAVASGLGGKARLMVVDHWPVLMGYDTGYGPAVDRLLLALAWLGVGAAVFAVARAARRALRERSLPLALLLLFAAANLSIALFALPHVPGNPRYILFLMSVLPVVLADALGTGWRRAVLFVLIATGAVASFAQVPPTLRQDERWRELVAGMEGAGVRRCYTDFFLATRINFLSAERIVCSAKLGPNTTEYFFDYRMRVEEAREAAIVAVNRTSAARIERRLDELGVAHERLDLMKPVILPRSRKVEPEELFPGREFPMR
jgi:hypothetical protein